MGVVSAAVALAVSIPLSGVVGEGALQQPVKGPDGRYVVRRGVDLHGTYDMSNLQIPENEIHTLLPKDAIPALTDPKMESVSEAGRRRNPDFDEDKSESGEPLTRGWLTPDARIIVVEVNDEVVGVPFGILDFHEVANMTVGGEPVAATYCPLCDSATVISRRVKDPNGRTKVLEFGVSGALYNSNVLMYDRTYKGLWSQLGMRAVSGPLASTQLDHYPVRIITFDRFAQLYPDAELVSRETGHNRPYGRSPYASYFARDDFMVPVWGGDDRLPKKTLGVGVLAEGRSWFIPTDAIGESFTLKTPLGSVELTATDAGVSVIDAPEGVHTAQTFYYSWSAFNQNTKVIESESPEPADGSSGGQHEEPAPAAGG